jgi:hypothetical protein
MAQSVLLKAVGLYSFPNRLGSLPKGALTKATNVVINRDGVVEPRRGFKLYGNAMGASESADQAKQLLVYKGRIIRHFSTTLQYDSNGTGTFASFSGTNTEVDSGLRIKGLEANGNFYYTTATGIKKISAASAAGLASVTPTAAGGIRGLDVELELNDDTGFLAQDSTVAYRVVWGIKDANQNLVLGFPSERAVIYNSLSNLLVKDFNSLLSSLDEVSNSGGINDANYLSTYKVPLNSSASTLKTNLLAVCDKIDFDTNITEGAIDVVSVEIASNTATVIFDTDVSTFLSAGDVVFLSGFLNTAAIVNGYFTLLSVGTTDVTFKHSTVNLALDNTANVTSGVCKRTKYSLNEYRTNDQLLIPVNVAGVAVISSKVYLRFAGNTASYIRVGDEITIANLDGSISDINGTYIVKAHLTQSSVFDTIQLDIVRSDVAEVTSTDATNCRVTLSEAENTLTLSDIPTAAQLTRLQEYYDQLVTDLQSEPAGIVTDTSVFNLNDSTQSATVDLTFVVPSGITTSYFYQIYRTKVITATDTDVLSDLDPGDEQGLVYEANPTSAEITAKSITVQDIVPESFRGANLYTNPNSGEGILQGNDVPPLAKDIALYKGSTFYANTETKQRKNISLLSVTELISGTSTFTITDGVTTNTYTFVTPVAQAITVTCVAGSLYASSGAGDYFDIYSAYDNTHYRIWFNSGTATAPVSTGMTLVEIAVSGAETANEIADEVYAALNIYDDFIITNPAANVITITNSESGIATDPTETVTDAGFSVAVTVQGVGEDAVGKKIILSQLDTPSQQVDETARSLIRVINKNNTELVYAYYLSGADDVPGLILLEAKTLGSNQFYLNVNSVATGEQFSPTLPTSGNAEISDNEVKPNRIYYSKVDQPEAVPIVNYQDVGPKDKAILRIISLRDSLFVLKEEGIYRLSGESAPFTVSLFDSSTILKAPDSAAVLNNMIYMFSDQGIARVTDTGVDVISRPIEDLLVKLTIPAYSAFQTATWGVGYESDRSYYLFTVKNTADTKATQCFKYNTFTNSWSILDISKRCGVVNSNDDRLYLGAADTNFIEQERKNFDRTDYADREIDVTISANALLNSFEIVVADIDDIEIGDVIIQTQYLTISQFNRLLSKLDNDSGVVDANYFTLLEASAGDNLRTKLTELATKLDADTGVTDTDYAATIVALTSSFVDQQTAFNAIVTKLNADTGVRYINYNASSGTTDYEVVITDIDAAARIITTQYGYPFIVGASLVFKHFDCEAVWAPETFEDPSILKHVREATIMFEDTAFTQAIAAYSSDLSPSFEERTVTGSGNGSFGNFIFGTGTFGGLGTSAPFRTLIPRAKMRCRYINCKFKHSTAREKFSIYGISLTAEQTSTRAYKAM